MTRLRKNSREMGGGKEARGTSVEEPHCIKAGPERKRRQKLKASRQEQRRKEKAKKKDHRKSRQDVEGLLNGVRTKDLIEARLECMEMEGEGQRQQQTRSND